MYENTRGPGIRLRGKAQFGKILCVLLALIVAAAFLPWGRLKAKADSFNNTYTITSPDGYNSGAKSLVYDVTIEMLKGETLTVDFGGYTRAWNTTLDLGDFFYQTVENAQSGSFSVVCDKTGYFYCAIKADEGEYSGAQFSYNYTFQLRVSEPNITISDQSVQFSGTQSVTFPVNMYLPRGAEYPDTVTFTKVSGDDFITSTVYDSSTRKATFTVSDLGHATYKAKAVVAGTEYECTFNFSSYTDPTGITIEPDSVTLEVGESYTLKAVILPKGGKGPPTISLHPERNSGGVVRSDGMSTSDYTCNITAMKAGIAVMETGILVRQTGGYGYDMVKASCTVTVLNHIERKEPTADEHGNPEYWEDADGNKYSEKDITKPFENEDDLILHNWDDGVVTTHVTCMQDGEKTYTCSVCDAKKYETIQSVGEHVLTHADAVAAGCETAGNPEYWHCSVCGKYFSDATATSEIAEADTVIAALGHIWGEWQVVTEATETEEGLKKRVCSRDPEHHYETEAIPKTGFTYSFEKTSYQWTKGSGKSLPAVVNRSVNNGVTCDNFKNNGEKIEFDDNGKFLTVNKDFSYTPGSLNVVLNSSYLQSLKVGKHTMKVYFTDGSASTEIVIKSAGSGGTPGTGDDTNMYAVAGVILSFLMSMLYIAQRVFSARAACLKQTAAVSSAAPDKTGDITTDQELPEDDQTEFYI